MRFSQPMRATQFKTHASSACALTWLWLKMMCFFGIDARRDEGRRDLARRFAQVRRVLPDRDRVHIHDAVDAAMRLLQGHELGDGAKVVAEMEIAGRLDAGENALFGGHSLSPLERARTMIRTGGKLQAPEVRSTGAVPQPLRAGEPMKPWRRRFRKYLCLD